MNFRDLAGRKLGFAIMGMVYAAAPAAQQALEEVVVTARQRTESLQDVPVSITAFTAKDIARTGIERAEDFVFQTPGVMMIDAVEVGDTQVSIRGINGMRDAETNFALIIDGVLYTNPSAFNREYADLRQIEILKGPQGALYGRNAAAGAVIITTNPPTNEFSAKVKASAANHDSYFVSGHVSGPIAGDALFGRFHVDYRTSDGFYKNVFLNKNNVDDFESYNVNGRLQWEPTDVLISYNANFAFEDVNAHQFIFHPNQDPSNKQETTEFTLKLDYALDWATATAWFLYSDIEQSFLADGTSGGFGLFFKESTCRATTASVFATGFTKYESVFFLGPTPETSLYPPYSPTTCDGFQYQERNQEDISFEIRLASPSENRMRWLGGFYYLTLDREVGVATQIDLGRGSTKQLFSPQNSISPTEQLVHDEFDTTVYAVFGQLAYDVTPDIEAALALRYDREEREVSNLVPPDARTRFIDFDGNPLTFGGAPLNSALDPSINPSGSIPDRTNVFEQLQPKLSLSWDYRDALTLFASWGVGFRSGGFNNLGSAATADTFINSVIVPLGGQPVVIGDSFDKEVSHSVEVGFKSRLAGDRVRLEGAIYHTKVDDMQFFEFLVGSFGLLRVVSNIDEVSITGGEFAGSALITDSLSVNAGISVLNGVIDENRSRPITKGNDVPYAPDWTFNLGGTYVAPVRNGVDFVGHINWSVVGPTWFHTVQDDSVPNLFGFPLDFAPSQRDTFDLWNVRAGFEAPSWTATLFVRNLLDEKYIEEVIAAPEFGGSFLHPGAGRSWGLEVSWSFE